MGLFFGTDGLRGIANEDLSFELAYKCGNALSIRKDDAPEVVLSRLEVYHSSTEPLKDYYAKAGILKQVEGQEEVEDTTALTLRTLGI